MIKRVFARLLPKGLTGQIVLVALAGLVLIQLLSIQIYRSDREEALGYVNSRNAMQRIISVVRLLSLSPPSLYHEILKASRSETLLLRLADEPLQPDNRSPRFEKLVRAKLGYPSSLAVEISAELTKAWTSRSDSWSSVNCGSLGGYSEFSSISKPSARARARNSLILRQAFNWAPSSALARALSAKALMGATDMISP